MNRPIPWKLYAGVTAATSAVVSVALFLHGAGPEGLLVASRWSARVSISVFLTSFLASSLARLSPGPASHWLMRERRHVGLAFVWAHFLHLCVFTSFYVTSQKMPSASAGGVGGAGYVAVALMAATSNDRAQRALGQRWKQLHLVLAHMVWTAFTLTYAGFMAAPVYRTRGIVGVAVCLGALGLRMTARFRSPAPGPAALPSNL
jgi:DMSO/TMAO reductase YedYZ heme-binding membrane subunit